MADVFTDCVGSFVDLADRLDRRAAVAVWSRREAELTGLRGIGELRGLTAPGAPRGRAHRLIGALVRIAAVDGGDDPDAALVLVHLLRPGALRRASSAGIDFGSAVRLLVGELTIVVRAFPWRRCEPTPGRLLLDAWHNIWRADLAPADGGRPGNSRPIDPALLACWTEQDRRAGCVTVTKPAGADPGQELVDVLVAAARAGILAVGDASLLWELAAAGGYGADAAGRVAKALGVAPSTVRRRRNTAVRALQGAARQLLDVL